MSIGGACKAMVFPLAYMSEDRTETFQDVPKSTNYLAYIINLAIMLGAGYLAWSCNGSETQPLRILYTVLAAIFSSLYLIYYLVYRVILGKPCGVFK